jgi:hypothetical protein
MKKGNAEITLRVKLEKKCKCYLSSTWAFSIAARRGEVLVAIPTPPSTTPPMESTSAFTRRAYPEPHPCIPTLVARSLSLLPSI